jgi:hypothetical protein
VCPCLDLDKRAEGQARYGKGASRRPIVAECGDVGSVHSAEVCHIGEENCRLHDVCESASLALEQRDEVPDRLEDLCLEAVNERAIKKSELAGADKPFPGAYYR